MLFSTFSQTLKWSRSGGYFGEPLVQMTTSQVALNCLIFCSPWRKKFDNSAPQLSFNTFSRSCLLGMYSKTMRNKHGYCWQLQNHVWIHNLRRSNWKITMLGQSAYFFVVLWHGRACQEMCGTILWVGKQDDSTTLQSINSMPWWPSIQRRRIEIRGRIVKSMLSNCSEILVPGTYWKTRYSMVSEQTCTIDQKMDQSLWQKIISFDLLYPSHMWLQATLPCGKHC